MKGPFFCVDFTGKKFYTLIERTKEGRDSYSFSVRFYDGKNLVQSTKYLVQVAGAFA